MGTDGEQALVDASVYTFCSVLDLMWVFHSALQECKDLQAHNIPTEHSVEVLGDILSKSWEHVHDFGVK